MAYWIKRIVLKTGEIVTERELSPDQNHFEGEPPFVGDEITASCRGRSFKAKIIWGYWPKDKENYDPNKIIPLRVEEI